MAQRSTFLAGTATVILGCVIALPFTLVHPVLPFMLVLFGLGLILLLKRWRWIQQAPAVCWMVGVLILILLIPLSTGVHFIEQGWQDGPFYGHAYNGVMTGEEASDRLDYRQGELWIYNRQEDKAPILAYQIGGDVQWARELDISQRAGYEGYQLNAITEPKLARGMLRDRLNFLANWSLGEDSGRAYIWKWNGFHRFFLNW